MNSLERVSGTLAGKPTDRRAISLVLSLYGAKLTGCPLAEYYHDPAAYARGQVAVRETFQPDILFGPFALPLEGAAFGSRVRFYQNQAPNLVRPILDSAAELEHLPLPDIESHPHLLYFQETIRQMAAEHGDEVPIAAIALNPVDLPIMLLGIGGWLETMLFDEAGTRRMLDITIPFFVRRVNALLAAGAAFVVMPAAFANPSIVTRDLITGVALPALQTAFAQVAGPLVIHSGGAPLARFLDLFAGLPNVAAFVLNGKDDPALARQKVGPDVTLIGNIEGPALLYRTAAEIQADCVSLLTACRNDPRFILGSSAADIAYDTPPAHIRAFCWAAEAAATTEAI